MGTIIMIAGQEIILVIIVALVLFGADKIPDLAKTVGKGMREFKKASDDIMKEINNSTSDIRKDLNDITDNVKKDIDKVTGTIMTEVNAAQTSVNQQINEISTEMNDAANTVQQSWSNEQPPVFNDTSEQWANPADGDYSSTFNFEEATRNYEYDDQPVADQNVAQQGQDMSNAGGTAYIDPTAASSDPESPYFDPDKV